MFERVLGLHVGRGGICALTENPPRGGGGDRESDQDIGHGLFRNGFDLDAARWRETAASK